MKSHSISTMGDAFGAAAPRRILVGSSPFLFQVIPHAGLEKNHHESSPRRTSTPTCTTVLSSSHAQGYCPIVGGSKNEDAACAYASRAAVVTPNSERQSTMRTQSSRRESPQKGESIMRIPTDKDVLAERGSASNKHKGHDFYWRLIVEHRTDYLSFGKHGNHKEKKCLALKVADRIFENGGCFLTRDNKDSPWYEMPEKAYIDKIQTALREEKNIPESAREYAKSEFQHVYHKFLELRQKGKEKSKRRARKPKAPRIQRGPVVTSSAMEPSRSHEQTATKTGGLSKKATRNSDQKIASGDQSPKTLSKTPLLAFEFDAEVAPEAHDAALMEQDEVLLAGDPPKIEWFSSVSHDEITGSTFLSDFPTEESTFGVAAGGWASTEHFTNTPTGMEWHLRLLSDEDIAISETLLDDKNINSPYTIASLPSSPDGAVPAWWISRISKDADRAISRDPLEGENSSLNSIGPLTRFPSSCDAPTAAGFPPWYGMDTARHTGSFAIRQVSTVARGEDYHEAPPPVCLYTTVNSGNTGTQSPPYPGTFYHGWHAGSHAESPLMPSNQDQNHEFLTS